MAELVDAADLKSVASNGVPVRFRPGAPIKNTTRLGWYFLLVSLSRKRNGTVPVWAELLGGRAYAGLHSRKSEAGEDERPQGEPFPETEQNCSRKPLNELSSPFTWPPAHPYNNPRRPSPAGYPSAGFWPKDKMQSWYHRKYYPDKPVLRL